MLATTVDTVVLSIVFGVTSGLFVGVLAGVAGILVLLFFFAYYLLRLLHSGGGDLGCRPSERCYSASGWFGRAREGCRGSGGVALRSVLCVADGVASYLMSFIVVLASPRRRLGDMVARTLVVRK